MAFWDALTEPFVDVAKAANPLQIGGTILGYMSGGPGGAVAGAVGSTIAGTIMDGQNGPRSKGVAPGLNNGAPNTGYTKSPLSPELRKAYEAFATTGYQGADKLMNLGQKVYKNGDATLGLVDQGYYDVNTGEDLSNLISAYNDWSLKTNNYNKLVGEARALKANQPGRAQTILGETFAPTTRSLLGGGMRPDVGTVKSTIMGGGY